MRWAQAAPCAGVLGSLYGMFAQCLPRSGALVDVLAASVGCNPAALVEAAVWSALWLPALPLLYWLGRRSLARLGRRGQRAPG